MTCDGNSLSHYLANFSGQDPLRAVYCPFVQGQDLTEPAFALVLFALFGLGLAIRTRSAGPLLVVALFSAGVIGTSIAGVGAEIMVIVVFFGVAAIAFTIYRRASVEL